MKNCASGILTKIRLIKQQPMIVRFSIISKDKTFNCIVANNTIANQILMLEENCHHVSVFGHYNNKQQLVIEKFHYSEMAS